jgi:hypothetical protein
MDNMVTPTTKSAQNVMKAAKHAQEDLPTAVLLVLVDNS